MEREYYLACALSPGIGPKTFASLLAYFRSAKRVWEATEEELLTCLGPKRTEKFISFRKTLDLKRYREELGRKQIAFLSLCDDTYPTLLRSISNPPIVLFVKGSLQYDNSNHRIIGIVGTRKVTSYGRDVTQLITAELVRVGCVVVSGLALGVDAVAHQEAVDQGGKTIAVLGCGVDLCYPSANQSLYHTILTSGGAIVSEYPPGQVPSVGSFPSRNRIIAGLCEAVVVTEGALDSGSLITAGEAIKNGRKVFAVPGPITSGLSKGPLQLLRHGAVMVTSGEDILQELRIEHNGNSKGKAIPKGETKEEQEIIDLLESEALLFDEIVGKLQKAPAVLSMTVSMMEMKRIVKRTQEGKFQLTEV